MGASRPEVRVHVASINTRSATELCIRSMYRYADAPFELVVGDCGSADGSLAMLRGFERRGLLTLDVAPDGRRHADWLDGWLQRCDRPWALFVDSDVEFLAPGWLAETMATAGRSGAPLVCLYLALADPSYVNPLNGVRLPGGRGVNRRQEQGGAPVGRYAVEPSTVKVAVRQLRKMAVVRYHLAQLRRSQRGSLAAGAP